MAGRHINAPVCPALRQLTADGSGDPAGATPAGVAVQIVATQGSAYEVQLGDGSFAWLDGTQVTDVPAPDALPPLPAPTPGDPASVPGDPTQATDATVAADLTPMEAN